MFDFIKSKFLNLRISKISIVEILLIVGVSLIPIFFTYPYRINIFLSWEGAYRLYLGQIPYKDFGIPMGFVYWMVPAFFFHLFGPSLISLVKAQVLLNIISGFSFRSIMKSFSIDSELRLLVVFMFIVSFSFFNFWPWYNHSVIVYELAGIALVLHGILKNNRSYLFIGFGGFFLVLSFLTKQDGGALGVLLALVMVGIESLMTRRIYKLLTLVSVLSLLALIFYWTFKPYNIGYWFNLGQAPHYSRFSLIDIFREFFEKSQFIKLYVFIIVLLFIGKVLRIGKAILNDKNEIIFFLFVMGILAQAAILQVSSYTPLDGNIYFHSFSIAYILWSLKELVDFKKTWLVLASMALILLWWSGVYWKYTERILQRAFDIDLSPKHQNVISINTYKLEADTAALDKSTWKISQYKAFKDVYMPVETIDGIGRLMDLPIIKSQGKDSKVLNMTELTPLAEEMRFSLEKGTPLWYHLGVGMFENELDFFIERIESEYYDVVIFEIIPNLNNFYPNEIRTALQKNYQIIDNFQAPRRRTDEVIEVYVKR